MATTTLPAKSLWGYGVSDFGQNLVFQTMAFFLLAFYTDVLGLDPAAAGSIFLIARIWDGVNDPLMGYMAQRTRSRWGSYRPYLLWMALPGLLLFVFLWIEPEGSKAFKYMVALLSYILFGMCFTAFNIPFGALTAVMTNDYHERGKLTGYRMTFALIGGILAAVFTEDLIQAFGGPGIGHRWVALLYGGILALCLLIGFVSVREKSVPDKTPEIRKELAQTWKMLQQNRPFWRVSIVFACCFGGLFIFASMARYYCQYKLGDVSLLGTMNLYFMGATALAIPLWSWFSGRIGKKNVLLMGIGLSVIAFVNLLIVDTQDIQLFYGLIALHGLGNGAAAYASWAMPADTLDYGRWKSGIQSVGLSYGIYGVCIKTGMGLGQALAGLGLAWVGYEAHEAAQPETIAGIHRIMTLGPMVFLTIAGLVMLGYELSPKKHQEIINALNENEKLK